MLAKFNFLLVFIQIATILNPINGQCNTCNAMMGIACISETDYSICNNGAVTNIIATCPTYAVCNVDVVCANKTVNPTPSCVRPCGVCTPDLRFACVDTNKFQMCYGTSKPTSPVLTCPTGQLCDYYAAQGNYCGLQANIQPVCTGPFTPTEPPTTQPPVTQPSTGTTLDRWTSWCRSLGIAGRFPYTSDPKCQAYIYCYVNNNLLYGNYYTCSGSSVFYPKYQTCVSPESYQCV